MSTAAPVTYTDEEVHEFIVQILMFSVEGPVHWKPGIYEELRNRFPGINESQVIRILTANAKWSTGGTAGKETFFIFGNGKVELNLHRKSL